MKRLLFIASFLVPRLLIGQYEYFNVNEDFVDWNTSFASQVELRGNDYIVCSLVSVSSGEGSFYGFQFNQKNNDGSDGDYLHETNLGGFATSAYADSFISVEDGYIYGMTRPLDSWMVKLDLEGGVQWEYFFPYSENEEIHLRFAKQLMDGNYLFVGAKNSIDSENIETNSLFLTKTEPSGAVIWETDNVINQNNGISITRVIERDNGELFVLATDGNENYLIRVDSSGVMGSFEEDVFIWGGSDYYNHLPNMVKVHDEEVNVIFQIGQSLFNENNEDAVNYTWNILRFNIETMSVIEIIEFAEILPIHFAFDYVQTPEGGFAILGQDWSGAYIRSFIKKYSSSYTEEWTKYYQHNEFTDAANVLFDFDIANDGGFICSGDATGSDFVNYPQQNWLLKLDACGYMEDLSCPVGVNEISNNTVVNIYPIPAQDEITIESNSQIREIQIVNSIGQQVSEYHVNDRSVTLGVLNLPQGVYSTLIGMRDGNFITRTIVVE